MASNNYAHLAAQAYRTVEMRRRMSPTLRARASQDSLFAREINKMGIPKGMQKTFMRRIAPDSRMTSHVAQGYSKPKLQFSLGFKRK